ncbi:hypothetical protein VTG60DRAFT_6343 [Thermothelomyces hinnuleus]
MCYMIPPEWTLDGHGIKENFALSDTDISFIRKMYPFRARNTGRLSVDPDIRKCYPPQALNSKMIEFDPPYPLPPQIAFGLTILDEDKTANILGQFDTTVNRSFEDPQPNIVGSNFRRHVQHINFRLATPKPRANPRYGGRSNAVRI